MSKSQKIYFDNAATSYPKRQEVLDSLVDYLNNAGNPGRGAHEFAMFGARTIMEARQKVASFLGIEKEERLVFTPGCTHSINYVIKGLFLDDYFKSGDTVLLSGLEHNSVLRPLQFVKDKTGIEVCAMGLETNHQKFLASLKKQLESSKVRLFVITEASNVTGQVFPVKESIELCQKYDVPVLVDAAQTAGKVPISLSESLPAFWCASGHKGLMGPPGVGVLYVRPGLDLKPLIEGGTGSNSEDFSSPSVYPDRLEAGTLPGPNIAGLSSAIDCLENMDLAKQHNQELELMDLFLDSIGKFERVKAFYPSSENGSQKRMPVVSIDVNGVVPGELSSRLSVEYGIAVRPGLHCAAQAHKSLGTLDRGLTRISFGPSNSETEIESLVNALKLILK